MRRILIIALCFFSASILHAQSKTVNVTVPGTLSGIISVSEQTTLTTLTVTGSIDARDVAFMRDKIKNLATLILSNASIKAYEGTFGTNSGVQTTYPANEMPAYAFYNPALLSYKPSLTAVTLPANTVSIGYLAFYYCWNLTTINIPASVKSIAEYSFYGCYALGSFTVDSSNTRFSSTSGVLFNKAQDSLLVFPNAKTGNYTVPATVKHIANSAFENCYDLISVTLPTSLTSIGTYAFAYCSGISGNLTIPNNVKSIGEGAFYGCYNLTRTVYLPTSLTDLGSYSFMECNNLRSFSVSATNPNYASSNDVLYSKNLDTLFICPGAKAGTFTIPNTVKLIGSHAFYKCSQLTGTMSIPALTDYIGYYAFYGCSLLTSYAVNPLNPYFSAENGILYSKTQDRIIICPTSKTGNITLPANTVSIDPGAFNNCTGITGDIHLPASINYIGEYSFYNCSGISGFTVDPANNYFSANESVLFSKNQDYLYLCPLSKSGTYTIPASVQHIGFSAFDGCSNLTAINIAESVQEIGVSAFQYCTGINQLTIPQNVNIIGAGAFYACSNLTNLRVAKSIPPVVDYYALELINKTNCTLSIPIGSLLLYSKAPYWEDFSNINEIDFNTQNIVTPEKVYQCYKTSNGLMIKNLNPGDWVEVYTLHGLALTKAKASSEEMSLHLPVKGIFIV